MESAHNSAENYIQMARPAQNCVRHNGSDDVSIFGERPANPGPTLSVAAMAGYTIQAPFAYLCISDFVRWRENRLLSNY